MDLIIHNARIWTGDAARPWATAVAVKDGVTAAVGGEELLELATPATRVIGRGGLPLLPGLGDSHLHLGEVGRGMEVADLSGASSVEELGAVLRAFIRERRLPPGQLVLGWGWNQDRFPGKKMPTLAQLDGMAPGYPILITRVCQHIAAANSAALAMAGITRDTPDPPGGAIGRDGKGEPDGILRENGMQLLSRAAAITPDDARRWLAMAAEKAASLGLTMAHSEDLCSFPGLGWRQVLDAWLRLDAAGRLPIRVVQQCQFLTVEELEGFFAAGYHPGWRQGKVSVGPLKIVSDGSLGARTALLSRPYADDPAAGTGMAVLPWERVEDLVAAAHRHGMGAVIHAIGDGALDRCLDAIQRAQQSCPEKAPRHGIVHCQITRPDQLERIRRLGVQVLAQPVFLEYDLHMAEARVGPELAESCYAWRTMVEGGIPFSAGSDSPIESMDPFGNLYCAVTRQDYRGQPAGGWHPGERLTLDQALTAATAGVAWAAGQEGETGRIAPGFFADYTAPDRDIFSIPPRELLEVRACFTVLEGRIIQPREGEHPWTRH